MNEALKAVFNVHRNIVRGLKIQLLKVQHEKEELQKRLEEKYHNLQEKDNCEDKSSLLSVTVQSFSGHEKNNSIASTPSQGQSHNLLSHTKKADVKFHLKKTNKCKKMYHLKSKQEPVDRFNVRKIGCIASEIASSHHRANYPKAELNSDRAIENTIQHSVCDQNESEKQEFVEIGMHKKSIYLENSKNMTERNLDPCHLYMEKVKSVHIKACPELAQECENIAQKNHLKGKCQESLEMITDSAEMRSLETGDSKYLGVTNGGNSSVTIAVNDTLSTSAEKSYTGPKLQMAKHNVKRRRYIENTQYSKNTTSLPHCDSINRLKISTIIYNDQDNNKAAIDAIDISEGAINSYSKDHTNVETSSSDKSSLKLGNTKKQQKTIISFFVSPVPCKQKETDDCSQKIAALHTSHFSKRPGDLPVPETCQIDGASCLGHSEDKLELKCKFHDPNSGVLVLPETPDLTENTDEVINQFNQISSRPTGPSLDISMESCPSKVKLENFKPNQSVKKQILKKNCNKEYMSDDTDLYVPQKMLKSSQGFGTNAKQWNETQYNRDLCNQGLDVPSMFSDVCYNQSQSMHSLPNSIVFHKRSPNACHASTSTMSVNSKDVVSQLPSDCNRSCSPVFSTHRIDASPRLEKEKIDNALLTPVKHIYSPRRQSHMTPKQQEKVDSPDSPLLLKVCFSKEPQDAALTSPVSSQVGEYLQSKEHTELVQPVYRKQLFKSEIVTESPVASSAQVSFPHIVTEQGISEPPAIDIGIQLKLPANQIKIQKEETATEQISDMPSQLNASLDPGIKLTQYLQDMELDSHYVDSLAHLNDADVTLDPRFLQVHQTSGQEIMLVSQSSSVQDSLVLKSDDDRSKRSKELNEESYIIPSPDIAESFDRVPVYKKHSKFAYTEVVRKQSERRKLKGFSCQECNQYYRSMGLSDAEIARKITNCSRHRARFAPPNTPEHFWSIGFPDTHECEERGYQK